MVTGPDLLRRSIDRIVGGASDESAAHGLGHLLHQLIESADERTGLEQVLAAHSLAASTA